MKTHQETAKGAWCLVRIAGRPCAVALNGVVEIIEAETLVSVPLCAPRVIGFCPHRRDLVPVVEMAADPVPETDRNERRPVVMIVRTEHGPWGIRIDPSSVAIAETALDDQGPPPPGPEGAIVLGAVRRGETTYPVIDPEETWRNLRDLIERWYNVDRGR